MDIDSLSHSKWNCKYHIVFAPKYRRQIIYGKIKAAIGRILRLLCERKGVEIVGINPLLALILYQGGKIGVKNIDNIINGSKKIKETFDF